MCTSTTIVRPAWRSADGIDKKVNATHEIKIDYLCHCFSVDSLVYHHNKSVSNKLTITER